MFNQCHEFFLFLVVGVLNDRFRQALGVCKELNSSGPVTSVDPRTSSITADKLIYNYAIEMVSYICFLYQYLYFFISAYCA